MKADREPLVCTYLLQVEAVHKSSCDVRTLHRGPVSDFLRRAIFDDKRMHATVPIEGCCTYTAVVTTLIQTPAEAALEFGIYLAFPFWQ